MSISAILFDLDGTLVDTERESAEAMARALASGQDITVTQEDRDFIIGRSWVDIYRHLGAHYPTMSWTESELIAATGQMREQVFAEVGITVLPGAREAIDRFAELKLAIVTGSSTFEARQSLRAVDRMDAFSVILASEDVPRSKPAPDGYLAAAQRLGVAPEDCLVIEDSAAGIAAGRAAGAQVVAVRVGNFHGQDQSAAHRIIDTLNELTPALLRQLQ